MRIEVKLLGEYSEILAYSALNLDDFRHEHARRIVDIPCASPGGFCDSISMIVRAKIDRDKIAADLTAHILLTLNQRDLIDGYPQQANPAQPGN